MIGGAMFLKERLRRLVLGAAVVLVSACGSSPQTEVAVGQVDAPILDGAPEALTMVTSPGGVTVAGLEGSDVSVSTCRSDGTCSEEMTFSPEGLLPATIRLGSGVDGAPILGMLGCFDEQAATCERDSRLLRIYDVSGSSPEVVADASPAALSGELPEHLVLALKAASDGAIVVGLGGVAQLSSLLWIDAATGVLEREVDVEGALEGFVDGADGSVVVATSSAGPQEGAQGADGAPTSPAAEPTVEVMTIAPDGSMTRSQGSPGRIVPVGERLLSVSQDGEVVVTATGELVGRLSSDVAPPEDQLGGEAACGSSAEGATTIDVAYDDERNRTSLEIGWIEGDQVRSEAITIDGLLATVEACATDEGVFVMTLTQSGPGIEGAQEGEVALEVIR